MLTILDVVKNNKVLLIDEIEDSLHPRTIEYLFNLFRSGDKAQLLCTTHNTRFLDLKKISQRPDILCQQRTPMVPQTFTPSMITAIFGTPWTWKKPIYKEDLTQYPLWKIPAVN
jgi:predicted ATPase